MNSVLLILLTALAGDPKAPAIDTVVVCPTPLLPALQPWMDYRQQQGHRLHVAENLDSAEEIRASIRGVAKTSPLKNVLLVGDVPNGMAHGIAGVPTHFEDATVTANWGSEPQIASDGWYADLDDDVLPDLAIGRLPAKSPKELSTIVSKIIRYEQRTKAGMWRRRVNFVAGVGGFGAFTDRVIESATRSFISNDIPAGFRTTMTYASWRSAYCPDPRTFRLATIKRMNEGSLLWIYIGHGKRESLDWVRVPTGFAPILDANDVKYVQVVHGSPIAVFLSCYAAAFDSPQDSIAEKMIIASDGPVAILGGSRVTMPYAMGILSSEMLNECFVHKRETLGEIFVNAKRKMVANETKGANRRMLDFIAKAINPDPNSLVAERVEHLHLFHLIGDPLLRIPHAEELKIRAARQVEPGEVLDIEIESPIDGTCEVELVCRRGHFTFDSPTRDEFDGSDAGMRSMNEVYKKANDDRWASQTIQTMNGLAKTSITVPKETTGPCFVRVCIHNEQGLSLGAEKVYVRRERKKATTTADALSPLAPQK